MMTGTLPDTPYRRALLAAGTKTCKGCGQQLPIMEFLVNSSFGPYCQSCRQIRLIANRRVRVRRVREPKPERTKSCRRCGEVLPVSRFLINGRIGWYCTECRPLVRREYWRNYQREQRKSVLGQARTALRLARRAGHVVRPNECELCGARCTPHGHHTDYSKPLDVMWVCIPCHARLHSQPVAQAA